MASIRSNLNSVPNVTIGLTALKNKFATCFQNWRQKTTAFTIEQHQKQRQQQQQQLHSGELSFHEKTIKNIRLFNTRLKKLFKSPHFERVKIKRSHQKYEGQKVETFAKLLSSTLLATTTTKTTTKTTIATLEQEELSSTSISMTIVDDTFLQIRDEYPDLESEIRSILLSRAQEGATISHIRDDYKKNTGISFPIYNNITDFLLSIPSVSAMCNELGTRIFNIVPTEKTKHLYEMILSQKPQLLRSNPTQCGRNRNFSNRQKQFQPNVNNVNDANNNNNYRNHYNYNCNNYTDRVGNTMAKYPARLDKYNLPSDSADSLVEYNCFYEDNYNYLNNRLNGPQNEPLLMNANNNNNNNHYANNNVDYVNNIIDYNNNNNNMHNFNTNNLAPYNNICSYAKHIVEQQPHEPFQQDQAPNPKIQNFMNPFRHQRPLRPPMSTSPTATKSSLLNESIYTTDSNYDAHLLDFGLLGDDFFLYLARMELKCKFKKYEKALQSGLCVSGQTIGAALKRIRQMVKGAPINRSVIVNIGSVDIMQGRPLVQIEHDFRELINVMYKNGITPILTTLAPLANYSHDPHIKERLERFNLFIKREGQYLIVIDIWSCLVNEKRQTLFDCYQNEPRLVTGTVEPYVFWNKIGRQRVLQLIQSKIEY